MPPAFPQLSTGPLLVKKKASQQTGKRERKRKAGKKGDRERVREQDFGCITQGGRKKRSAFLHFVPRFCKMNSSWEEAGQTTPLKETRLIL